MWRWSGRLKPQTLALFRWWSKWRTAYCPGTHGLDRLCRDHKLQAVNRNPKSVTEATRAVVDETYGKATGCSSERAFGRSSNHHLHVAGSFSNRHCERSEMGTSVERFHT